MRTVPLKRIVGINLHTLPETTEPGFEFRYVDIGAVGRGQLISEPEATVFAAAPSRARRLVRQGDTIISTVRTYLGAVWPVRDSATDLVVSTGFAVLTPGPGVDSRYLGWLAQSDVVVEEVVARSVGVSYPAISPSDIGTVRVPLPPLARQRVIADYLDRETARIDALIEKYERLKEHFRRRLDARISRTTCASWVGMGGALPSEWRALPLRRCFDGVDYGIGDRSQASGPIAVLGMGNVEPRKVVGEPGGYVESLDDRLLLLPGDLLFNRTNSLALVGKVAIWLRSDQPTTFASYIVRLRTAPIADARYLNYLLNTGAVLTLARAMALPSIGQANLNPNRYGSLRIPLPSLSVQRRLAGELEAEEGRTEDLTAKLRKQVLLLAERRQTLIAAAVTGELDIREVAA